MGEPVTTLERRWTYREYCQLEDGQRYQLIEGMLLKEPAPATLHQHWLIELNLLLTPEIKRLQLGTVLIAPLDIVLDEENTVQPDLVFVAAANSGIIKEAGIFGSPDLAVEIISPSSVQRDRRVKRALYARFGIQEYWLADPADRSLEILTLRGDTYELLAAATGHGKIASQLLDGFQIDLASIG